jgi:hypothetical protein
MYGSVSKIFWSFTNHHIYQVSSESERETLIDLEFISNVGRGDKINVIGRFVQKNGIVTNLSRTFWNIDNKENTINFCTNTVKKSFNIIKMRESELSKFPPETDDYNRIKIKIKNIIKLLCKTINGLKNLQVTYVGFTLFISQIEQLIGEIKEELELRMWTYFNREEIEYTLSRLDKASESQ